MEYSRSIIQIIKERSSRRSYTPQPVETEKLGALTDFFAALAGPFGGKARFAILDTTGWGEGKINALGTYGTIQGASPKELKEAERAIVALRLPEEFPIVQVAAPPLTGPLTPISRFPRKLGPLAAAIASRQVGGSREKCDSAGESRAEKPKFPSKSENRHTFRAFLRFKCSIRSISWPNSPSIFRIPGEHLLRYHGWYSNKTRGQRGTTATGGDGRNEDSRPVAHCARGPQTLSGLVQKGLQVGRDLLSQVRL